MDVTEIAGYSLVARCHYHRYEVHSVQLWKQMVAKRSGTWASEFQGWTRHEVDERSPGDVSSETRLRDVILRTVEYPFVVSDWLFLFVGCLATDPIVISDDDSDVEAQDNPTIEVWPFSDWEYAVKISS